MTDATTQDRIERQIDIDASAATVWAIISEPGWWVNDGELREHTIDDEGDGVFLVHDEAHGQFRISVVTLDEPHYAAFRWQPTAPDDPSTLTELWIEERPGGVTLRVAESDFASLPADKLDAFLADNSKGWEIELAAARTAAESR